MTDLAPGTAVFETDFISEAKFYAARLGPDFTVTAGIDTLYAVRVKAKPENFGCITKYDPPPIPTRKYDWTARLPNADENSPVGFGSSKADAIADLMIELES